MCAEPDDAGVCWRVKIGDFGLAAVKTVLAEGVNQQFQPTGSVLWMVNFILFFEIILCIVTALSRRHLKLFNRKIPIVTQRARMYMRTDVFYLKCLAENYRTRRSTTKNRLVVPRNGLEMIFVFR